MLVKEKCMFAVVVPKLPLTLPYMGMVQLVLKKETGKATVIYKLCEHALVHPISNDILLLEFIYPKY